MSCLAETDIPGAQLPGERIRSEIEVFPFILDQVSIQITISKGICVDPLHGQSMKTLVALDQALYRAKETGRNQVWFASLE